MAVIKDKGIRDEQMIAKAYYDLFSMKDYKPKAKEISNWVRRFRMRERFKREERLKND